MTGELGADECGVNRRALGNFSISLEHAHNEALKRTKSSGLVCD